MFVEYTYQDYVEADDKLGFIQGAIVAYKSSDEFKNAKEAELYFKGENPDIINRPIFKMTTSGREVTYSQNIAISNFFFRFVVQQNQFLLANGLQLKEQTIKDSLGPGFDKALESIGEKSLVHGVCWGYWNNDKLEVFKAVEGDLNGFFALLDEEDSKPRIGIRYWQIRQDKPMRIQLFMPDGMIKYTEKDGKLAAVTEMIAYKRTFWEDAISSEVTREENYGGILPIIPLYANEYNRSEFTPNIKTKIDMYDKIFSDFGDNLERTNDIYWVISNFGGTTDDIREMIAEIEQLKATYSESDGSGNSTATPHTIEVPYAARQTALDLLKRALYQDYMAMDMDEIRGGSLTNVAIKVATTNMEMKANRYEWQVFQFCQQVLKLAGIQTENIKFKRQAIANEQETMTMLMQCREDLDLQTALEKNPLVQMDEVEIIMSRLELERMTDANDRYPIKETEEETEEVILNAG